MVKLLTSIVAASALVISAKALDVDVDVDALSAVSLDVQVSLDAASLEHSEASASEEASVSEAWNVEVVEDEDAGLGLMAQLGNYIQNLIHPNAEEDEEAEEADDLEEDEEIQEAVEMNENESVQQKKVKRSNYRRKLVKRAGASGPFQDEKGHWHYPVPKVVPSVIRSFASWKPSATFNPGFGLNEAPDAPQYEQFEAEVNVEQDLQNSVQMEAFPFGGPNFFNPFLIDALIPKSIKSEIAAKVKAKIEAAAATNSELSKGLAKASEIFDKATKAFDGFKNKHPATTSHEATDSAEPTSAAKSDS